MPRVSVLSSGGKTAMAEHNAAFFKKAKSKLKKRLRAIEKMKIPDKKKLNKIKKASKKLEQNTEKSIHSKIRITRISDQIGRIKINIEKGKLTTASRKNVHRLRSSLKLIREELKKEKNTLLQIKEKIKKYRNSIKTLKRGN